MNWFQDILKNNVQEHPLRFINDLMRSFSMQTDTVIDNEIQKFHTLGLTVDYIEISREENIFERIDSYLGLESHVALANDEFIEEVFTEKLPSLTRRSAFQTIYSTYEIELQKLCLNYQSVLGGKKLERFDGVGLTKVSNFVIHHFPQLENSSEQRVVNEIRKLRNQCIHDDAKAFKNNGTPIEEIHSLISNAPKLFHLNGYETSETYQDGTHKRSGSYVVFEKGSLEFVISCFVEYALVLDEQFRKRT